MRSKRVTWVVIIIISILILGWWLVRPYLLTLGALSPDEVVSHPERYLGKKISVVGYYYSKYFPIGTWWMDADGFITSVKISEALKEGRIDDFMKVTQGSYLLVKLPPNTSGIRTEGKYVFTGIIEMGKDLFGFKQPPKLVASSIVSV